MGDSGGWIRGVGGEALVECYGGTGIFLCLGVVYLVYFRFCSLGGFRV